MQEKHEHVLTICNMHSDIKEVELYCTVLPLIAKCHIVSKTNHAFCLYCRNNEYCTSISSRIWLISFSVRFPYQ